MRNPFTALQLMRWLCQVEGLVLLLHQILQIFIGLLCVIGACQRYYQKESEVDHHSAQWSQRRSSQG